MTFSIIVDLVGLFENKWLSLDEDSSIKSWCHMDNAISLTMLIYR